MVDAWIDCSKCKYRFSANLTQCPKCKSINHIHYLDQPKIEEKKQKQISPKRLFVLSILGVVISTIFIVSIINTKPDEGEFPNPYVNTAYGFSIQYPSSWNVEENVKEVVEGEAYNTIVTFYNNNARIDILAEDMHAKTIEERINEIKQDNIDKGGETFNLVYINEGQSVMGNHTIYHRESLQTYEGVVYKSKSVFLAKNDDLYTMFFSTSFDQYDKQVDLFDNAVSSFNFLD